MQKIEKILAVIPARGGSKGVPRKNIRNLNGKPLIAYSIEAAQACSDITDLIVSTEDDEIAEVSEHLGASAPFRRPADLADDRAPTWPVIRHALEWMETDRDVQYDAILLLQPTCPLRTTQHIERAIEMIRSEPCDSVVSIVEMSNTHPFRMKRMIGNRLINYIDQGFEDMRPRQVLPKVYLRNGAIYLTTRESLLRDEALVGPHCLGMEMTDLESANIDGPLDFLMAEAILSGNTGL